MLDLKGISASSGSACTSGSLDPSHVLLAIGLPHEVAHGSLRLSFGDYNTMEDIDYIIETLPPIIERLRAMSPLWDAHPAGQSELRRLYVSGRLRRTDHTQRKDKILWHTALR